jgi:hypothetical protein
MSGTLILGTHRGCLPGIVSDDVGLETGELPERHAAPVRP